MLPEDAALAYIQKKLTNSRAKVEIKTSDEWIMILTLYIHFLEISSFSLTKLYSITDLSKKYTIVYCTLYLSISTIFIYSILH